MKFKTLLTAIISVAATGVGAATLAASETPSLEEMWQIIQAQRVEIDDLKAQLSSTDSKLELTEVKVEATADAIDQVGALGGSGSTLASWTQKTSLGGYGEHHYNHFEDTDDQIDAHRYVLYVAHEFNNDLRFFSEVELEHSIAAEGAPGEIELEQAFIEWDFARNQSVQFGQFLLPIGILNETHEPDTFYGTERNKVESEVIPATWWEAGVMFKGEIAPGFGYNAALHSGLKTDGLRIRDGRQKNAEAVAEDMAFTGRLKYTAIPGLELAASLQFQQNLTQGQFSDDADALLWEAHAVYQSGGFGLRALWAQWDIDGDEFAMAEADKPGGWYIEPSYKVLDNLGLFVRYSEWERGDKFDISYEAFEYGLNYWLNPHVVLKADYTDMVGDSDDDNSFNLGVGWSF